MSNGVNSSAASIRGSFGCPRALRKSWTMGVGTSLVLHVLLPLYFFSAYGKKVPWWQTCSGLLCPEKNSCGGLGAAPGALQWRGWCKVLVLLSSKGARVDPDTHLLARQGRQLAGRGRAKVAWGMSRIAPLYVLLMLLFWKLKAFRWMMMSSSVRKFYNQIILCFCCRLKT